ncbi:hypothetical protein MMC17_001849 [Xylographa soralifera]|nr:hypothetical protein [Xylographa soralifera]
MPNQDQAGNKAFDKIIPALQTVISHSSRTYPSSKGIITYSIDFLSYTKIRKALKRSETRIEKTSAQLKDSTREDADYTNCIDEHMALEIHERCAGTIAGYAYVCLEREDAFTSGMGDACRKLIEAVKEGLTILGSSLDIELEYRKARSGHVQESDIQGTLKEYDE